MADSQWLVDFAIGLVNFALNLPINSFSSQQKQAYFDHIPILFNISKTIYRRVESYTSF